MSKKSKSMELPEANWAGPQQKQPIGLRPLAKYLKGFLLGYLMVAAGCVSVSNRRGSSANEDVNAPALQFLGEAYVCILGQADKQVQFYEYNLSLNQRELTLSRVGVGAERIQLSTIDSVALYPGDVSHPYQLQLVQARRLLVVQVLSAARNNDDQRTQQLYERMVSQGVPRGRSDQFYYVGMSLEEVEASEEGEGFFAASAGVRLGSFLWDSLKGLGSLLVKPFMPLF